MYAAAWSTSSHGVEVGCDPCCSASSSTTRAAMASTASGGKTRANAAGWSSWLGVRCLMSPRSGRVFGGRPVAVGAPFFVQDRGNAGQYLGALGPIAALEEGD